MRATEDAKKKAAQAETAPRAEAAVASSTATTAEKESSGPSLPGRPTGAAALASKMTDSIGAQCSFAPALRPRTQTDPAWPLDSILIPHFRALLTPPPPFPAESIRQQAREVMRAPASFSQPSLGPGDALQCAVSASGPIRLLATVLVAVSFARISLGGPVGRIPLQWQEKAIQLLAHPRFAGLAEIAAKTFAAFNPILLLVSLQACIVLSFVLMVRPSSL